MPNTDGASHVNSSKPQLVSDQHSAMVVVMPVIGILPIALAMWEASQHTTSLHVYMQSSGSAGQASILRASKRSGGQENVPGSGNAVERRTPHFAPLPQSDGPPFSEGPGGHGDLDDMSQSDQPSQEEGDENKVNKKMTRVAKSLMSQHLRRKSLVSKLPWSLFFVAFS